MPSAVPVGVYSIEKCTQQLPPTNAVPRPSFAVLIASALNTRTEGASAFGSSSPAANECRTDIRAYALVSPGSFASCARVCVGSTRSSRASFLHCRQPQQQDDCGWQQPAQKPPPPEP